MAENTVLDTEEFVSSKRASQITGYAQDYIGQLARGGQIVARRIGGLWHVSLSSLDAYKSLPREPENKLEESEAETDATDTDMFVSPEGIEFISANRASKLTGYHQDYIGQLARGSKILSRQVGSRWYVGKDSLLAHKHQKDALLAAVQAQSVGILKRTQPQEEDIERTYEIPLLTYLNDGGALMPQTPEKELADPEYWEDLDEAHVVPIRITKSGTSTRDTRMVPNASFKEVRINNNIRGNEDYIPEKYAFGDKDEEADIDNAKDNGKVSRGKSILLATSAVFAVIVLFMAGTSAFRAVFPEAKMTMTDFDIQNTASVAAGSTAAIQVQGVFEKTVGFFERMLTTEVVYRRQ